MELKVENIKKIIVLSIISSVIFIYLIANKQFGNITLIKYLVMLIGIVIVFSSNKFNKVELGAFMHPVFLVMILQFFFLPLIVYLIQGVEKSIKFSFISILYIIFCNSISYVLAKNNMYKQYIKIFYILTLAYIIVSIIENPIQINFDMIYQNLFSTDNRISRAMYGFVAPNAFAILAVSNILAGEYILNSISKNCRMKFLIIVNNIIILFLIITTGSRGALLSLLVYYLIFYFNRILANLNKRVALLIQIIIIVIALFYGMKLFDPNVNYSKISSGRVGNWSKIVRVLEESDNTLFGVGYLSSNDYYNNLDTVPILTDNWFVHTLATQGGIGLVLGVILVITSMVLIYRYAPRKYDREHNYISSFTLSIIIYSGVENMLFSVNFILSFLYLIAINYYLIKYKIKRVEGKNEKKI